MDICSDDNKCMDDDDKGMTMIANLCYFYSISIYDNAWLQYEDHNVMVFTIVQVLI